MADKRDNSGVLFRNDKKKSETSPDAKGNATIAGVDYWVASWQKKDKNGNPYRSLAFTKKEDKAMDQTPEKSGGNETW